MWIEGISAGKRISKITPVVHSAASPCDILVLACCLFQPHYSVNIYIIIYIQTNLLAD